MWPTSCRLSRILKVQRTHSSVLREESTRSRRTSTATPLSLCATTVASARHTSPVLPVTSAALSPRLSASWTPATDRRSPPSSLCRSLAEPPPALLQPLARETSSTWAPTSAPSHLSSVAEASPTTTLPSRPARRTPTRLWATKSAVSRALRPSRQTLTRRPMPLPSTSPLRSRSQARPRRATRRTCAPFASRTETRRCSQASR
mmetsp:Transcript_148208/g.359801  ORF Transcript_148208/g.359801 Transcript_148208/m.359801 type:complete len:204 (+) Transcript_148208:2163-2774(+)